jgi:hypothetical protein
MFKYVKYEKVQTEYTELRFNGSSDEEKGLEVLSIKCDTEATIDELIASQPAEINCQVITKDEFKAIATASSQINRCRAICKEHIAKRYDLADELSMTKRDSADAKVVEYEKYRNECIAKCTELKAGMGY